MFFPKDIQEIPDSDTPAEKLFFAQAALPDTNTLGGGGKEWTRKLSNRRRTSHPRTPSQLEMSSRRLRRLNLSPKIKVLALRLLTPRKMQLRTKPRFIDVGFSFIILLLFFISLAFATVCNMNYL